MEKNKWVWSRDVDGNQVPVQALPKSVGLANFADDKYRSLMYFSRDIGFAAGTIPFQEFYWGAGSATPRPSTSPTGIAMISPATWAP